MPLVPATPSHYHMTSTEKREEVLQLEEAIKAQPDAKLDGSDVTEHKFCEGVYLRICTIPAGMVVVGHIHRKACLNIVLTGRCLVFSEEMDAPQEYKAGDVFESGAGIKKAVYAIEDCKFTNALATTETDPSKVEELFTIPSYDLLEEL